MIFDSTTIYNLFNNCLVTKESLKNGAYIQRNCLPITGFTMKAYFDKQRIRDNKDNIIELLNQVRNLDEGVSILATPYDELGNERISIRASEMLMCMGLACDEIEIIGQTKEGFPIIKRKVKEISLKLV